MRNVYQQKWEAFIGKRLNKIYLLLKILKIFDKIYIEIERKIKNWLEDVVQAAYMGR